MLYAIEPQSKERIRPSQSGQIAICPGCGGKMHAVMATTKISHWRHEKGPDCDPWYEPMSAWHIAWQDCYPEEWKEVTIKKGDTKHRADIRRPDGKVIEFQKSGITVAEALEREAFYGDMCWVFYFGGQKGQAHMVRSRIPAVFEIEPMTDEEGNLMNSLSLHSLAKVLNSASVFTADYTGLESIRGFFFSDDNEFDLGIFLAEFGFSLKKARPPYIMEELYIEGKNSRTINHLQKPVFVDPGDDMTEMYYRKSPGANWTTLDKAEFVSKFNQHPRCPTP